MHQCRTPAVPLGKCASAQASGTGAHPVPSAAIMSRALSRLRGDVFFHLLIFLQGYDCIPIHAFIRYLLPAYTLPHTTGTLQFTHKELCSVSETNENTTQSGFMTDEQRKCRPILSWERPLKVCNVSLISNATRKLAALLLSDGVHALSWH